MCVSVQDKRRVCDLLGQFSDTRGIVVDDDGFVYVSDYKYAGKVYVM